ncbi:MAG: ATP-NAD kinase family protein [Thermoplasmata archaeon]|nr:ATP-NAD kinase family protein [Thermoplasmata archaeon]
MRIGFIVNPLAGRGGAAGLGGSDGFTREDFDRMNAKPISQRRAEQALNSIKVQPCFGDIEFLSASGEMGEGALEKAGIGRMELLDAPEETTAEDTIRISKELLAKGIDLLIFVGGDGTARDILSAIGKEAPILGIPSGVKMHSSVFVNTPEEVGQAVQIFFELRNIIEREVMDVDEEEFRSGRVSAKLYGTAIVPDVSDLMQSRKSPTDRSSETDEIEELVGYFVQSIEKDVLYLLGTGSTISSISKQMGINKNELGVNAIMDGEEIGKELDEKKILELLEKYDKRRTVVTPIGGQGFIFGRGNLQLSAKVIASVENEDIMIIATPSKLSRLKILRIDTGDPEIDARLRGYWKVLVGFGKYRVMMVQ